MVEHFSRADYRKTILCASRGRPCLTFAREPKKLIADRTMKPAKFTYACPQSVDEVLSLLAQALRNDILAGGQSLVPLLNLRMAEVSALVDVNRAHDMSFHA